jgi:hypothetical protein
MIKFGGNSAPSSLSLADVIRQTISSSSQQNISKSNNTARSIFSLKVKSFSWEKYKMQVVFLILSLILIIFLEFIAIPIIILLYVILSVVNNAIGKKV